MNKADISPEIARQLVAIQFPQWADLPVRRVARDGWDNTTFRLGEELTIRMPSHDAYVGQIAKEHQWLPVVGKHLPLQIPVPVALGESSDVFPRPWSVYRWIVGQPADTATIADPTQFAHALAQFLRSLYSLDASEGPAPGKHNFFRGAPLDVYGDQTREAIDRLGDRIDRSAAVALWEDAIGSRWVHQPVWVHGDVAPSNLLVVDGQLRAVIDFGCAAVGDPACDLVIAWTFLEHRDRQRFREIIDVDDATWTRGKAWALWKALITLADSHADPTEAMTQFGWRLNASELVDLLLNERQGRNGD